MDVDAAMSETGPGHVLPIAPLPDIAQSTSFMAKHMDLPEAKWQYW